MDGALWERESEGVRKGRRKGSRREVKEGAERGKNDAKKAKNRNGNTKTYKIWISIERNKAGHLT